MSEIITIATQKGGTGKTTTVNALGAALSLKGYRVLMVDMDPQANLTFTMQAEKGVTTSYDILIGKSSAAGAIFCNPTPEFILSEKNSSKNNGSLVRQIIPAAAALSGLDLELTSIGKEYRLIEALKSIRNDFDYIIIDTPPSLGILTINSLTASDSVVITAQADVYSLQGIWQLFDTIEAIHRYTNPQLIVKGILLTRHNPRSVLTRDLTEMIEDTAGQLHTFLYKNAIREGIAVKEAQASRRDLFSYAPKSKVAQDYRDFADEFLERSQINGPKKL